MVNSKFRLIRSYREIFFYNCPNISCLKCTVNSNFHLIRSKTLPTNDFELTVADLYQQTSPISGGLEIHSEPGDISLGWGGRLFAASKQLSFSWKSCCRGTSDLESRIQVHPPLPALEFCLQVQPVRLRVHPPISALRFCLQVQPVRLWVHPSPNFELCLQVQLVRWTDSEECTWRQDKTNVTKE